MARIRTVKPSFFRHRRLYLAEIESGFPLRVAFEGLWTCADREGRFEWEPDELKLDCLPYDQVDFSRVLDALATRGFIVRYACHGRFYGHIPSFKDHQVINNKESASRLPVPADCEASPVSYTREAREDDATATREREFQGEGKGREQFQTSSGASAPPSVQVELLPKPDEPPSLKAQVFGPCLAFMLKATGQPEPALRKLMGKWCSEHGDAATVQAIVESQRNSPLSPVPYIEKILRNAKAEGTATAVQIEHTDAEWCAVIEAFQRTGNWPISGGYGTECGMGGCIIPAHLIVKYNLDGMTPPLLARTA